MNKVIKKKKIKGKVWCAYGEFPMRVTLEDEVLSEEIKSVGKTMQYKSYDCEITYPIIGGKR